MTVSLGCKPRRRARAFADHTPRGVPHMSTFGPIVPSSVARNVVGFFGRYPQIAGPDSSAPRIVAIIPPSGSSYGGTEPQGGVHDARLFDQVHAGVALAGA